MPNFELPRSQNYTTPQNGKFCVQFWGVRGLVPTPGSNTIRYGGNTVCVAVQVAGKQIIFDGGTGLRILGKTWQQLKPPPEAHIFFTNSQSNRIQGFPFFAPAFVAENRFHIYGCAASNSASIKQSLCDQMLQPYFPYPLQVMESDLHFHYLIPGKVIELETVKVVTALINQAQRSVGYRVSWQGQNIAYVTDLDPSTAEVDGNVLHMIQGADVMIANATYTAPTAHSHESANVLWQTAVNLACSAGVKQLVISNHHPDDNDDFLDQVQTQVKSAFPRALLAREGLVLVLSE
jgi:phosphoribosyl 1,2-cyclic phosphodiesterase